MFFVLFYQANSRLVKIVQRSVKSQGIKGASFLRNCGAASVGVLQDNLVLSTGLIKPN